MIGRGRRLIQTVVASVVDRYREVDQLRQIGRSRRRRHRVQGAVPTGSRRALVWAGMSLVVLVVPISVMALLSKEPTAPIDQKEATAEILQRRDTPPEVVDCVLRMADRDLTVRALSEAEMSELSEVCGQANRLLAFKEPEPEPVSDDEADRPMTRGEDPALDELWDRCEAGSGVDCNKLFGLAPIGSEYEQFGLTCGDRPAVLYCESLDESQEIE